MSESAAIDPIAASGPYNGTGDCVYEWSEAEQRWILVEDRCIAPYKPGSPPPVPGEYDGQQYFCLCMLPKPSEKKKPTMRDRST